MFQAFGQIQCTWSGFVDKQSGIEKFIVTMGTSQGSTEMFGGEDVNGDINAFNFNSIY